MKKILQAFLALSILLFSCKDKAKSDKEKFIDDLRSEVKSGTESKGGDSYDITPPDGWTKNVDYSQGHRITFLYSPIEGDDDTFRENINVLTERVGKANMDDYLDLNISNMETSLTGFTHRKVSDISIKGQDYKSMLYSHNYEGVEIDARVLITIKDGTAYIITCSAPKGRYDRWHEDFEKAIRSFEIN